MQNRRRPGRPCHRRKIRFNARVNYFKPQGIPLRELKTIELSKEELEALRLKNLLGLDQLEAAERMNTSQSTFQRILTSAYFKLSTALVRGQAIKIK